MYKRQEIDNQDRLREASLELISTPFREDEVSGADRFLEADVEKQYASYIYAVSYTHLDVYKRQI